MKRLLILFLFLLFSMATPSAYIKVCYILAKFEINPYNKLFNAICMVESSMNPMAIKEDEQAYGIAQIRQCRLNEYNRLTGKLYNLTDCFNPKVAREIFMYYCQGRDFQTISRAWNGGERGKTKKSTQIYWRKVKSKL